MINKLTSLIQTYSIVFMLTIFSMGIVFMSIYLWGTPDPAAFIARYPFTPMLKLSFIIAVPATLCTYFLIPHKNGRPFQ